MFYKQIFDFDFSKLDYFLISLFVLLGFIGLLVLTTASVHFSDSLYGNPTYILNKQLYFEQTIISSFSRPSLLDNYFLNSLKFLEPIR